MTAETVQSLKLMLRPATGFQSLNGERGRESHGHGGVEMPDILRCSGRDRMYVSAFVKRILKRYLR
jgi:hypothetical protein